MCDGCGCGDPEVVSLPVHERILSANDHQAEHNREHFHEHAVLAIRAADLVVLTKIDLLPHLSDVHEAHRGGASPRDARA